MSGQLVGEVIAEASRLRASGLSKNGYLALVAIAEKCQARTRQGSVRWDHIRSGLYGASKRTAERAVRELKEAGLVRVVHPGWANQHGESRAPIYELRIPTQLSASSREDTDKSDLDTDKSELDTDKSELDTDTQGVVLDGVIDGSIDGSIDGGCARDDAPPPLAEIVPTVNTATANPTDDPRPNPYGHLGLVASTVEPTLGGITPPSEFCLKHQPFGTDDNCHPCGRARRFRGQQWAYTADGIEYGKYQAAADRYVKRSGKSGAMQLETDMARARVGGRVGRTVLDVLGDTNSRATRALPAAGALPPAGSARPGEETGWSA